MKRMVLTAVSVFCLGLIVNQAYADRGRGRNDRGPGFDRSACVRAANKTRNTCQRSCQNDFEQSKEICQAQNAFIKQCIEACLNTREACLETARQPLTQCITAANTVLESELAVCAALQVKSERLECNNTARVKAYSARLACQTQFKLNAEAQAAIAKCISDKKTCISSCKSVPTPAPTGTPAA